MPKSGDQSFSALFHIEDMQSLAIRPKKVMDALLEAKDTSAAVQALSPMAFYDLYHAVGPGDAGMLLAYASSEQVQNCLDLDIWRGDQIQDEQLAPWVEQMLALPDEKFAEFWRELDPEIMALYLHRNVQLYASENKDDEVDIPEDAGQNVAQSPDFSYWIAYPEDPDKAELLRQLIDRLYAVLGIERAWSTLESMHWEMESDLEENAYRFRTERIREYGYMPRDEAAAIFAKVSVAHEVAEIRKATDDDLYVKPYPSSAQLDSAIARLDDDKTAGCYFEAMIAHLSNLDRIRTQLYAVTQQVATFDGFQPHEPEGFADSMILAVANINLGLEYASGRDDALAVQILEHVPLHRLFTLGYNVTLELQHKAKLLVSRGHLSIIEDSQTSLLTNAQRDAIAGMLLERPRPAESALTPFISVMDIREGAAVIADVATRELFYGEGLHKTKDDISLYAYTHDLIQGVENINFDNVAVTFLTRKYLKCDEAWDVFTPSSLPHRADVLKAIQFSEIRPLFKSNLPESSEIALKRFALQLQASVDENWPKTADLPDPQLVSCIVIAEDA
jgi:hypothetical protein